MPEAPAEGDLPETDVLIVEDEPVVRSVMATILTRAGYTITAVENGEAALAAVHARRYRAIVCDVKMPVVDGLQLYEQLESLHPALASRVIFVTAVARAPKVAEFLNDTGRPVFEKPYELKALVLAVADLVNRPPSREMLL
ncbi:MAG: response regulator [Gemmatimonadetes bacterium]|nr:response regulator [Gemmatimonadota bacterium]